MEHPDFPFSLVGNYGNHIVDAELMRISYGLYTAQVRSNAANARLQLAEANFQEASSRDPTFVSRAHICYDVFAQLQQADENPDGGLPSPSPSFSELYSPRDSYGGHNSTGDFDYSRFAEAFDHMFPGAGTPSVLKPCIAPALLYTPSPPAETAGFPTSYFSATGMFPSSFGSTPTPDPVVEEDKDELAALELAMTAGDDHPHSRASAIRPASPPAFFMTPPTSSVTPPRRPSLTKSRRRPRSESTSDSGRGPTGPPSLRNLLNPGSSLPSPGISSGSDYDEAEEDAELSADEFVPGARRTSASGRGAGDVKKRRPATSRRNSGESSRKTSGNKTRRQPREIAYNPDAVFELNEDHLFFLVTAREIPELSERCCLEIFLKNASPVDLKLNSEHRFTTDDDEEWTVRFTSAGAIATPRSLDDAATSTAAKLSFAHFPPGSMTFAENLPVGSLAWWRIQACSGPSKHRGMPGSGDWTARFDANPKDRRPARIVHHFAECRHRRHPNDALGSFARSILGPSTAA